MTGRGRLSSIELLGEDYDDILAWAAGELRERRQLQVDILGEFNRRLAARAEEIGEAFEPVSKSAFSRYSVRQAHLIRRLDQTREISKVFADRLQPGETDKRTIMLSEMIKNAVFEALDEGGEAGLGMKDLKAAGDALKSAVAAQKTSADLRLKLEASIRARVETAIDGAAAAAETAGETSKAELLRKIREDVYGLFEK